YYSPAIQLTMLEKEGGECRSETLTRPRWAATRCAGTAGVRRWALACSSCSCRPRWLWSSGSSSGDRTDPESRVINLESAEVDMAGNAASTLRRKPYGGMQMEGPLARWYAHTARNRRDHLETARAISERLAPGSAVLEVAPGPRYMAVELARLGSYE